MDANDLSVPTHIQALAPYQAGKPLGALAEEFGLDPASIIQLASNENPLGMPQPARQAAIEALAGGARYPDANGHYLKEALSRRYGVPLDWLTLGNGSNDILNLVAAAFLGAGRSAVYAQYGFVVYKLAVQASGSRHIEVPARQYGHDLDAMRSAIASDTRVVYLANPNNPTGTFLPGEQIAAFVEAVRRDHGSRVIVVLDEAYNEYLAPELRFDSVALVRRHPNLIVARTFSKAYALAGLRVGFAIAQPAVSDYLNRVRETFNVSAPAQAAAIAALHDTAFLEQSYEANRQGLRQLTDGFDELKLDYVPSVGNFVMVRLGAAAAVHLELLKRGVIVRHVAGDGLPEWLRISVGLPRENQAFLTALREILAR
ncbi:MAG: histidinol-phosphate transaminase [Pigmentiphaga sp.]|nr:histidinol-phosphate transaminase [Pigmentiphaga sp.]